MPWRERPYHGAVAALDPTGKSPYQARMLRSMTGFGAGRAQVDGEELAVEIKSVNHKFSEVKARLPRELAPLEQVVVREVKGCLARGAVEVTVRRGSTSAASASAPTP